MTNRWPGALISILICQAAGVVGTLTTETGSSAWYQALTKPPFQPPGWVFGPVWITLYTLMGVAAWRIWPLRRERPHARRALWLFAIQLGLNAAWTPVFFGAHAIAVGLLVLVGLVGALAATAVLFARVDRPAAWLLVPYLLWALFATVLNAAILALN